MEKEHADTQGDEDSSILKSALFKVTTGTTITMTGTVIFLVLSLLWRVVVVRLITVNEWGEMSLVLAFIGVLTALAPLGIQTSIARNIAYAAEEDRGSIVRSGLMITTVSGLICTVAIAALANQIAGIFRNPGLVTVIYVLSPSIVVGMVIGTLASVFQGFQDAVPYAIFVNILPNVLSLSIALLLYSMGFGFFGILLSAVLNSVIVGAVISFYSRRKLRVYMKPGPRKNMSRMLLAFGLPLLVVFGLNALMGYADTLIMGYFTNESIVGYYSSGITLGRIVSFSLSAMTYIFMPVASQMISRKRFDYLERTYSTAMKWSLLTSVPLMAIFILYPGQSLSLTFGPEYSVARSVLAVSAAGAFVISVFGPAASTLVAFGRTRLLAVNSAISVSFNITACLVLIPRYGMVGGAYASVVGTIAFALLSLAEVSYLYRLQPFNRLYVKPLTASLALSFIILLPLHLRPNLIELPVIFLAVAICVIFCILVTKSVDKTDVLVLEVVEEILGRKLTRIRRIGTMLIGKT